MQTTLSISALLSNSGTTIVRSNGSISDRSHQLLVASIKSKGLISPITIAMIDQRYVVVDGFRRLLALKEIRGSEGTIGRTEFRVTDEVRSEETSILTSIEIDKNTQKLNGYDKARAVEALDLSGTDEKKTKESLGCSDSYLRNMRQIAKMSDVVKQMVEERTLGIAHALQMVALPHTSQEKLAIRCKQEKLSLAVFKTIVAEEKALLEGVRPSDIVAENRDKEEVLSALCKLLGSDDRSSYVGNKLTLVDVDLTKIKLLLASLASKEENVVASDDRSSEATLQAN